MRGVSMSIKRILIVCQGNTCRSPMAAAIASSLLGAAAEVQSAGLDTADGLRPTNQALTVMKEMGLDINHHRSRSLRRQDLTSFDLIIAMTPSIVSELCAMGADSKKILGLNISDPYGESIEVYRITANEILGELKQTIKKHI
ncbi:MAG: low molecular weight protein arginine phosphatase [Nitrospirota bacterium]